MSCSCSCRHFAVLVLFLVLVLQGDCTRIRMMQNVVVPSAVLVVGTLYCDACSESDQHSNKQLGHFIPGASVEVACKLDDSKHAAAFRRTAITDTKGSFQFKIPGPDPDTDPASSIKINCTLTGLLQSKPTLCTDDDAVATTSATPIHHLQLIHLNSAPKLDGNGIKAVYSAGTLTLKPQKRPAACDQQIIDHPAFFFLPPNPLQPPNIVGIPLPQNPLVPPPMSLLPPGLQPAPPSLIPPGLPLLPSPPPSKNLLPPLPILEPPPSSSPPALPILPPGLPLVPPGLPLVPPGLPLVPPGLPIPPSSALEKKDAP